MRRWLPVLLLLCVLPALAQTNPTNNFHLGRPVHNAGPGWGLELNANSATIDSLWNNIITGCAADGAHAITWDPVTHFNCTAITGAGGVWGGIGGTLSNQTDLQNALNLKANAINAALSGIPTAPTAANGTNNTQLATTAFVLAQIGIGGGVGSWNGRVGAVVPAANDYTFSQISTTPTTLAGYGITDAVPNTRTVAGHPLSANIAIAFADIITTPTTLAGYGITDAVPSTRTVNGKSLVANITLDLGSSDFAGQNLAAGRMPALTGDCTTSAGTVAITCTKINGNSVPSGAAAHQMLVAISANAFALKTIPDCNGGTNAINYTQSTDLWSCLSITALTNPMTTLGDMMAGGVAGVNTRVVGPTSPAGIPQSLTSTPSGGVAAAPLWNIPGVPVDNQTGTTQTIPITDDVHLITYKNASAVAASGANMLANNYAWVMYNLGAGLVTYTAASGTVNDSGGTAILPQWWFGFAYTDNTNTQVPVMPTLKAFPNCTDTGGNHLNINIATGAITCGTSSSTGGGTVTVVGSGSLTNTALMTGGGANTSQTACAGCILDSSGNMSGINTYNKVTVTQPAASATLTIANTKTLTATNTMDVSKTAGVAGGFVWADTTASYSTTAAGTAKQVALSGGTGTPTFIDFPDTKYIPAANNVNGVGGIGWTCNSATPVVLLRAGTNNKDALLSPWGASDVCYFKIQVPKDWDTATFPYVMLELTSTDVTNGHTIIMQESVTCAKLDGSTTDDVAFNAARSLSTVTLNGNANRTWESDLQLNSTDFTGCVAPSVAWVKISRTTDTATNVGVWGANVTVPRLLTVQAN